MNLIYLHGFKSSALSIKGQQLKHYCERHCPEIRVHLPDLNLPPVQALARVANLIEALDHVALVGSSLGGFYATQLVARYAVPAVLINPAMRPWQLFHDLFAEQLPYPVTADWSLDQAQLQQLEQLACKQPQHADKILLLLQQGDKRRLEIRLRLVPALSRRVGGELRDHRRLRTQRNRLISDCRVEDSSHEAASSNDNNLSR